MWSCPIYPLVSLRGSIGGTSNYRVHWCGACTSGTTVEVGTLVTEIFTGDTFALSFTFELFTVMSMLRIVGCAWGYKKQVPPKCGCPDKKEHGTTFQTIVILIFLKIHSHHSARRSWSLLTVVFKRKRQQKFCLTLINPARLQTWRPYQDLNGRYRWRYVSYLFVVYLNILSLIRAV